jgi:hypothetical protein
MALHTVFNSTNMASTKFAERIFDVVSDKNIDNGTFGYLGDLADGDSVYNFKTGVKDGETVVVIDNPAWSEDESSILNRGARNRYTNEAGKVMRARVVKVTDEFGISVEGIEADSRKVIEDATDFASNKVYLTIGVNGKLVATATVKDTDKFVAQVMRKRIVGGAITTPLRTYGAKNAIYEAKVIKM